MSVAESIGRRQGGLPTVAHTADEPGLSISGQCQKSLYFFFCGVFRCHSRRSGYYDISFTAGVPTRDGEVTRWRFSQLHTGAA